MRIGIDARLVTYRRGMGNFVYQLLAQFAKIPADHKFFLYVDSAAARELIPADPRFTIRVLGPRIYPIWEQLSLPRQVAKDRIEVLHCPANTAPIRGLGKTRLVLTLHDVMYLLPEHVLPISPSLYQRLGRHYRRLVVPRTARQAASITADSQHSRDDIAERLRLPPDKVAVVYLAPGPAFRRLPDGVAAALLREHGIGPEPFVLAFGAVDPRKNTARIIAAFAEARADLPAGCRLVLVGLPAAQRSIYAAQAAKHGPAGWLTMLGFVDEATLVALYNAATMLAYPSLYEGFGLPVLEAMACGTPAITSNSSSLPEVAGDAALMVSPTDTPALAAAMVRLGNNADLRRDLVERGYAQVARFTWPQTAAAMLAVYEQSGRQWSGG